MIFIPLIWIKKYHIMNMIFITLDSYHMNSWHVSSYYLQVLPLHSILNICSLSDTQHSLTHSQISSDYHLTSFEIHTPDRIYVIRCYDQHDCEMWMRVIKDARLNQYGDMKGNMISFIMIWCVWVCDVVCADVCVWHHFSISHIVSWYHDTILMPRHDMIMISSYPPLYRWYIY